MSHSQFHCTGRVYLDLHGLIFETSICYWQDQPGSPSAFARPAAGTPAPARALGRRESGRRPANPFPGRGEWRERGASAFVCFDHGPRRDSMDWRGPVVGGASG